MRMYITLDIGGTNTRIANSENLKNFVDIEKFATPTDIVALKKRINEFVTRFTDVDAISVGVAGIVDHIEQQIVYCPHIKYLKDTDIHELIGDTCKKHLLENDAALAGLGEAVHLNLKSLARVAYITISTGVGGTLIINERIQETRYNFEPGHHIVNADDKYEYFGRLKGTWESFCSGTAFKKRFGMDPSEINDPKIWNDYGEVLAYGLHNITLLWRPDVIILGGSMSKKSNLFYKSMEAKLKMLSNNMFYLPEVKISDLGDSNGLLGGLELIRQSISGRT